MTPNDQEYSTPRSGAGFALAITLAIFTFWVGGLIVQLHAYSVEPPVQRAAAKYDGPCPPAADSAVQCVSTPVAR